MTVHHPDHPWLEPSRHGKGQHEGHIAEYIAPQPPAGSHHRYVYLVFEQHEEYTFPWCFRHIFPKTMEARAGFNLRQFVEASGLKHPVAGNYFFVKNDEAVTGTLTRTVSTPSPTTTWVRSAPCTQPVFATAATPLGVQQQHVRGPRGRQTVM